MQTDPAYGSVEGVGIEVEGLGVHNARLDVREAHLSNRVSGGVQHVSRNVRGQYVAARPTR